MHSCASFMRFFEPIMVCIYTEYRHFIGTSWKQSQYSFFPNFRFSCQTRSSCALARIVCSRSIRKSPIMSISQFHFTRYPLVRADLCSLRVHSLPNIHSLKTQDLNVSSFAFSSVLAYLIPHKGLIMPHTHRNPRKFYQNFLQKHKY